MITKIVLDAQKLGAVPEAKPSFCSDSGFASQADLLKVSGEYFTHREFQRRITTNKSWR